MVPFQCCDAYNTHTSTPCAKGKKVITIKKKTKGVIYVEDLLKAIIKSLFNKR